MDTGVLACVAAVDDNVGQVLTALEKSDLKDDTIVVLASDHGFHMGEKNYLYKNSLWEESTRVPLIFRVPGLTQGNSNIAETVSLIDIYPTLMDLCGLPFENTKNIKGHSLDGKSLKQLMGRTTVVENSKESIALSAVYAGPENENDPSMQHYAIRTNRYRYILYNNGLEELYDHENDPHEWTNIAEKNKTVLEEMRQHMKKLVAPISLKGFTITRIET